MVGKDSVDHQRRWTILCLAGTRSSQCVESVTGGGFKTGDAARHISIGKDAVRTIRDDVLFEQFGTNVLFEQFATMSETEGWRE